MKNSVLETRDLLLNGRLIAAVNAEKNIGETRRMSKIQSACGVWGKCEEREG